MDADPFPMRGDTSESCGGPAHYSLEEAMAVRIPKSVAMDVIRQNISVEDRNAAESGDRLPELTEEIKNAISERRSGDGFNQYGSYRTDGVIHEVIVVVLTSHVMGTPVCLALTDANRMGIPGTTLSVRRVLRTLMETGQNQTTSVSEIWLVLPTFGRLCRYKD